MTKRSIMLATSNMDVRNKVQASVSESNMNNDEKGLGEKDNE